MERRRDYIDAVHDAKRLEELRALPLERKIQISQARIIEWYRHFNGKVVVSFSGGKDSTVLLHMVRSIFPDVKAVFSNTGLEYPEIQQHVLSYPNVDIIRPSMRFDQVISTYGYPLIDKEVAEAIYYARRIRSQSLNVERESSQSGCGSTDTPTEANRTCREPLHQRTMLQGKRLQKGYSGGGYCKTANQTQTPPLAGEKDHLIETSTARNRRTVLMGKMGREPETEPG